MSAEIKNMFSSKILLFGEYTLIKGSQGLAFPLREYCGAFKKAEEQENEQPHFSLEAFCKYLQGSKLISERMNLNAFEADIEKGYYFDSNIPQGYGIGSSGALCAAVYARYSHDFERKDSYSSKELMELKDAMALMECFYHGSSSGLDCLISLIDRPVFIEDRNIFHIVQRPDFSQCGSFYLYDSGESRKTAPLVHSFLNRYEEDDAYKSDIDEFVLFMNRIIADFLDGNKDSFREAFYELSRFQYLHFSEMIPQSLRNLWLEGLETKEYFFKFCGAGGGGFFMVYSDQPDIEFLKECTKIT